MMNKLNWLDKTIGFVSPQAGARRMRARILQDQLVKIAERHSRNYDAASRGRRTENWNAKSTSANWEIRGPIRILRDRSRDLIRNEGYATRSAQAIVSNVIGAGIIAKAKGKTDGRSKIFDVLWNEWAGSLDCDVDGRNNFAGIQALAMRCIFESGEVFIRLRRRPSSFNLPVPIQLQILEPDFLNWYQDGYLLDDGGFIVQGIEFDKYGRRRAYHLFTEHPGGSLTGQFANFKTERVPADEILHLFRVDRPGQVRGVPWMAPIMVKLRDLGDYSDATLLRQKLSACFTAFVRDTDGAMELGEEKAPPLGEKLEPGIIEVLPPGKSVEFSTPPTAGDFSSFSREQLRQIASGIGVTYEVLTNDYSQVNFSSGRMGWIEFQRSIDVWRWHMIVPHLCIPAWRWFREAATLEGYGSDLVSAVWTAPRREMIDPDKEISATIKAIRGGLTTQSEAIREYGNDPSEVFAEREKDDQIIDEKGFVFDSDPRKVTAQGMAQQEPAEDESGDSPEEKPGEEVDSKAKGGSKK